MVLEEAPRAYILIAVLHAVFPVWAMRSRRHAPFGRTVFVHDRQPLFGHVCREGGIPECLLGNMALGRYRTRLAERHALRLFRRIFFHPVDIFRSEERRGGKECVRTCRSRGLT